MSEPAPRLAPLPPDAWPREMREALAVLRPEHPRQPFPPDDPDRPKGLNVLGTFAHYPALAKAYNTFCGHVLFGSALPPRWRELLVLRVAHRRGSAYEWRQHVVLAADAGIAEAEISQIVDGPDAVAWSPFDAALIRAADELIDDARVTDATWATLAADLDTEQLMDVVFTVGAYDALAMAFRTFGTPLDDDLS